MAFENEKELLERQDQDANIGSREFILDESNEIAFPGYPYTLEALGERILVCVDLNITGYECKICKGRKRRLVQCECVTAGHPRKRYSIEQLKDFENTLGWDISQAREAVLCPSCGGHPEDKEHEEECSECKGKGSLIIIPKTSKNLPQTGVVVSMGAEAKTKAAFRVGQRILFSQTAGGMIPTKAGVMIKYMDWYNAISRVGGAEELGAFDFIIDTSE